MNERLERLERARIRVNPDSKNKDQGSQPSLENLVLGFRRKRRRG